MVLIEDKAQQANKHKQKNEYWEGNGILVNRLPLPVGDYVLVNEQVKDVIDRKTKRKTAIKKMDFLGTYKVCVDTKFGIEELVNDVVGKQHERFRDECILAQNNGIKLYILVENDGGEIGRTGVYNSVITDLKDLHSWKNPRLFIMKKTDDVIGYYKNGNPRFRQVQRYPRATKGQQLMKACMTMEEKYGCSFIFCRKRDAGKEVIRLLTEYRE